MIGDEAEEHHLDHVGSRHDGDREQYALLPILRKVVQLDRTQFEVRVLRDEAQHRMRRCTHQGAAHLRHLSERARAQEATRFVDDFQKVRGLPMQGGDGRISLFGHGRVPVGKIDRSDRERSTLNYPLDLCHHCRGEQVLRLDRMQVLLQLRGPARTEDHRTDVRVPEAPGDREHR